MPQEIVESKTRAKRSHVWEKEANEHYVEPRWIWPRFFEVEPITGNVCDPCCGFGRSVIAARLAGLGAFGCDLVDRGFGYAALGDFLASDWAADNFVFNPPFTLARDFVLHALKLAGRSARHDPRAGKVAALLPLARLPAAGVWIEGTPLVRVYLITPRPSMPPGHVALEYEAAGKQPTGGTIEFCICVWSKGEAAERGMRWLRKPGTIKW